MVDYKDFSGDGVHFQIQLVPDRVPDLLAAGAHAKLKLVTRISTGRDRRAALHLTRIGHQ